MASPSPQQANDLVSEPIQLDGTTLEGGGQLVRLALGLSCISGRAIHITRIRGTRTARSGKFKRGRTKGKRQGPAPATQAQEGTAGADVADQATSASGAKGGGLNPSLLAATQWLAAATEAETEGMVLKSSELHFGPRRVSSDIQTPHLRLDLWRDVYGKDEAGVKRLLRRESNILLDSPGSVSLIFQAVLPYLLFGATSYARQDQEVTHEMLPLRLTIQGGTNVTSSPSFEYLQQVLIPMLNTHVFRREDAVQATLLKRGWCTGSRALGKAHFDVIPPTPQHDLRAFEFKDRGEIRKLHVTILAPSAFAAQKVRDEVTRLLLSRWSEDVDIDFPVYDTNTGHSSRLYLLIVAETSNGFRLGRDALYQGPSPKKGVEAPDAESLRKLVANVVGELGAEFSQLGCVDEHLQDQLVIFQALVAKGSVVVGAEHTCNGKIASLHTQTARWVVKRMLGLKTGHDSSLSLSNLEEKRSDSEV